MKRSNGWEPPFHPLQIASWFAYLLLLALFYGVCVPNLVHTSLQASFGTVGGVLALITLAMDIKTASVNPEVRRAASGDIIAEDGPNGAHLNASFCNICRENVPLHSLHCRECGKCIERFDHHCLWLNTCVGKYNYRWFFSLLLTTTLYLIVQGAGCGVALYMTIGEMSPPLYETGSAADTASFVFLVIYSALLVVSIANVAHLFGFHLMLNYRGLTTYEYLVNEPPPARTVKAVKPPSAQQQQPQEMTPA